MKQHKNGRIQLIHTIFVILYLFTGLYPEERSIAIKKNISKVTAEEEDDGDEGKGMKNQMKLIEPCKLE